MYTRVHMQIHTTTHTHHHTQPTRLLQANERARGCHGLFTRASPGNAFSHFCPLPIDQNLALVPSLTASSSTWLVSEHPAFTGTSKFRQTLSMRGRKKGGECWAVRGADRVKGAAGEARSTCLCRCPGVTEMKTCHGAAWLRRKKGKEL